MAANVFISSTFEDLQEFRQAASTAAHAARIHAEMKENWTAEDHPPLVACLERVRASDLLVVMVARRYGWVPDDDQRNPDGKSITWLECEEAVNKGKDVLAFVLDDKAEWPAEKSDRWALDQAMDLEDEDESMAQVKKIRKRLKALEAFKQWLNDRGLRQTFSTTKELQLEVEKALNKWLEKQSGCKANANRSKPERPAIPSEYLDWVRRSYAGVELLGQDIQDGRAITLNQVYVPALVEEMRITLRGIRGTRIGDRTPDLLLYRIDQKSLYCPAPPGAGKSTFCRWAVLQSLPDSDQTHPLPAPGDYQEPIPDRLRTKLPLLVELRDFWRGMACDPGRRRWGRRELEQALASWVDQRPLDGLTGELLLGHLSQGSAFLLLDGLDEVPTSDGPAGAICYPRDLLLSGLADALPSWQQAGNRILLTSRPYGLDETGLARLGLERAPLAPVPELLQALFVQRWFHTLDKSELADGLIGSIQGRNDLQPLAENPMLLTALCVIYGNGRRLPEDRYHLYQRIIDNVLFNRYPGDARQREPIKARLEAVAHGMHLGPDQERHAPAAEVGQAEVDRLLAEFARLNPAYADGRIEPVAQREELLTRSGLLLPRGAGRAAFYHLSFQEFLAAERIARTADDRAALEQVFRQRGPIAGWRPTLMFLFAAQVFQYRDAQWGLELLGRLTADLQRAEVKRNPALAQLIAEALELCLAKGYAIPEPLVERMRRVTLEAIEDEIEIQARQALGLCLGRLGDPRIYGLRDPRAYVEVQGGDYVYGEDKQPLHIDKPFKLARYPVTNGQYQAFVADGGYGNPDWWSEDGWQWRQENGIKQPLLWGDRQWNAPNQPVVGVSFWEAEACCAWAGGRLPSEQEWEAAARGPASCEYPWCGEWRDGICNSAETGLNRTSPVGLFPRSRQASLGLEDLAGNVWEWCDSFWNQGDDEAAGPRVLRGGAFYGGSRVLRATVRFWLQPEVRDQYVGFRCVLAPRRQP